MRSVMREPTATRNGLRMCEVCRPGFIPEVHVESFQLVSWSNPNWKNHRQGFQGPSSSMIDLWKMVIFHSYVKLAEGTAIVSAWEVQPTSQNHAPITYKDQGPLAP